MLLAHRLSYELHIGPIGDSQQVLHSCDKRTCVNPGHLFLGSHRDNMDDMVKKQRQARGITNSQARLTEDQVRAIRQDTGTQRAIAKSYDISQTSVWFIKRRKKWKHLED